MHVAVIKGLVVMCCRLAASLQIVSLELLITQVHTQWLCCALDPTCTSTRRRSPKSIITLVGQHALQVAPRIACASDGDQRLLLVFSVHSTEKP